MVRLNNKPSVFNQPSLRKHIFGFISRAFFARLFTLCFIRCVLSLTANYWRFRLSNYFNDSLNGKKKIQSKLIKSVPNSSSFFEIIIIVLVKLVKKNCSLFQLQLVQSLFLKSKNFNTTFFCPNVCVIKFLDHTFAIGSICNRILKSLCLAKMKWKNQY